MHVARWRPRCVSYRLSWLARIEYSSDMVWYRKSSFEKESPCVMMIETETNIPSERRTMLAQRFRECIVAFPYTPAGERAIANYAEERTAALANYGALLAMLERGDQITDAALDHLLPYASSVANRTAGRWLVHGAMMTDGIRHWARRDASSRDWDAVADALLRLVQRCVLDPGALGDACIGFAALPATRGLQMGMLSPILSALRPDAFYTMSSAARRVVNYFAGTRFTPRLTDYPAANSAARAILTAALDQMPPTERINLPDADSLDLFAHWLVTIKQWDFPRVNAWRIATPLAAVEENGIALAANNMGDMATMARADFDAKMARLTRKQPERRAALLALWSIAHSIREGDTLLVHRGAQTVLALGTVSGQYYFEPSTARPHRLPVTWETMEPLATAKPGWRQALARVEPSLIAALRLQLPPPNTIATPSTIAPSATPSLIPQPANGIAEAPAPYDVTAPQPLIEADERLTPLLHAIERKGQAIISGPPGTGKTYLAERLAQALIAGGDGFSELVQFHPAYAYEDFIQGLRPQTLPDGQLTYTLVPGRFMTFCQRARARHGRCVLIIDEINRANLASVFGELMYLLEYRDRVVPLAAGGTLQIPANVRLIGTMNTADRSLALVDYALRRRFAFLPLRPDLDLLRDYHTATGFPIAGLISVLQRVNIAIADPHYELGISYFLRDDLATTLPDIWRQEIEPYLEELFFDQPEKIDALRWDVVAGMVLS